MKRIFRSIINITKDGTPAGAMTIAPEELKRNYKTFLSSKVAPDEPSFIKLYTWIEAHVRAYKEVPSIHYLFEKAQDEGSEQVMATLKDIATQTPYIRSDFLAILREKHDSQNEESFRSVLTNTWTIVHSGLEVKKKTLKGIVQGMEYFSAESRKFRINATGVKTDSQIRSVDDGKEVIEGYNKRKKDPLSNMGLFTYLDKIDDTFRGTKMGELFIVAAYVAQGKTTFVANLAYNGIIQGQNGMYIAMEMNFEEMRDYFYTLHTCYPDWYEHPKYKSLAGKISYEKVCYGELSGLEQDFFEDVARDFSNKEDFGELFIVQPTEHLTPARLEMDLYDRQAALAEKGKNLDFVVVDYVGLMIQDKNDRYGDFNIDLNNIIKRLKNIAINFDSGRGLRMITPFQVNRDGWKDAVKNDGVYKLTALSNANESERASDQIISLFMSDEMKKSGMIKVSCLKNRRGGMFPPFDAHIDFTSRRIRDFLHKKSDALIEDLNINDVPVDV